MASFTLSRAVLLRCWLTPVPGKQAFFGACDPYRRIHDYLQVSPSICQQLTDYWSRA